MDIESIKQDIKQFAGLKEQAELISKRQSEIKGRLTASIDEFGAEDERGHIILNVPMDADHETTIMKQKRVSKVLDAAAAEIILTKKGIYNTCIKMEPVLDEAAIMAAFYDGHLTEEDIDTMFPSKVTYAFLVK